MANKKKKSKLGSITIGKIVNTEGLALFTRQLSTLLQAGMPLLRSLEVIARQERNKLFKPVLESLAENVRSGNKFSEGLLQHPKIFDKLYINMVKAGEAGGILDTVLERLATFSEKSLKTQKKVKSAMVYPVIVLFVAFAIIGMLMTVVIPKFQDIFEQMLQGKALPWLTQKLMDVSNFITSNALITLGIIVVLFIGSKLFLKSTFGKKCKDKFVIKIPQIGDLIMKAIIARFTRTFGTLLSSGVPILEALNITKETISNVVVQNALKNVHDRVRDGENVATPLEQQKIFPPMVTSMVDVGEETGQLSEMLNRVANNYDEDVDNAVSSLTSIIEPIMIVFLAVVVGVIVVALFLPIIEIIKSLSTMG